MKITNEKDIINAIMTIFNKKTWQSSDLTQILAKRKVVNNVIKIPICDYINVGITLIDNDYAFLKLVIDESDNSLEYKEAKNKAWYLENYNFHYKIVANKYNDNSLICFWDTHIDSINELFNCTCCFIRAIRHALSKYDPVKDIPLDWNNILFNGAIVYLVDNEMNPIKDETCEKISAIYVGNNQLEIYKRGNSSKLHLSGTPDCLANLLLRAYSHNMCNCKINGNECWTFNNKRICDYKMEK